MAVLIAHNKARRYYEHLFQAGLNPPVRPPGFVDTPNVRGWIQDINAMCVANPGVCPGVPAAPVAQNNNMNVNMEGGRRRSLRRRSSHRRSSHRRSTRRHRR